MDVESAVAARVVEDAWRRVLDWLGLHAPGSHAALLDGADPERIDALEAELGVRVPVELRALWLLTAGDGGVAGAGCLPGNEALMSLDAVAAVHRLRSGFQERQEALDALRPDPDGFVAWRTSWLPVVSHGASDHTSGWYLDTESGYLGRWSRHHEGQPEELDTLGTYLEEVADMLEAPSLATRDTPGLVGDALVWGSRLDPAREGAWRPLAE
ncbi:SMI1/KNR4 family protein [Streptomyces hydrogenans]|uniref:SMI1/KNR4 family protein n=1 Tax=Streptomyces hydrogenans TaxID=1873719 RepID=UPI003650585F